MSDILHGRDFIFYKEHKFHRITGTKLSSGTAKKHCEELLNWFELTPLSSLDASNSEYFNYLKYIDKKRNLVGDLFSSPDKIEHMYNNTKGFLEASIRFENMPPQTICNIVGLYIDFKINTIDSVFWFMRPVIYTDIDTFDWLFSSSETFKKIVDTEIKGESIAIPLQSRLSANDYFNSEICSKIYAELQPNCQNDIRYLYVTKHFIGETLFGFYNGYA